MSLNTFTLLMTIRKAKWTMRLLYSLKFFLLKRGQIFCCCIICGYILDGWIDGWMNGWMDRWMDGWVDGYMDWWICMDGKMDECLILRFLTVYDGRLYIWHNADNRLTTTVTAHSPVETWVSPGSQWCKSLEVSVMGRISWPTWLGSCRWEDC